MIADMTTLKNRMIILGINQTPMIASTFGGPVIAQLFYDNLNYRWAFGAFCIMLVGTSFPVAAIMLWMQYQAKRAGRIHVDRSNRKWYQSIWHYSIQFDGKNHVQSPCVETIGLTSTSGWYSPHHRRVCSLPLAVQHCGLCSQWLGYTLYHRHDYPGPPLPCFVLRVGMEVLARTVPSMALS